MDLARDLLQELNAGSGDAPPRSDTRDGSSSISLSVSSEGSGTSGCRTIGVGIACRVVLPMHHRGRDRRVVLPMHLRVVWLTRMSILGLISFLSGLFITPKPRKKRSIRSPNASPNALLPRSLGTRYSVLFIIFIFILSCSRVLKGETSVLANLITTGGAYTTVYSFHIVFLPDNPEW